MYKSKEQRINAIKKYVAEHQGSNKSQVIKYLDSKGIGSKVPLSEDLKELIEDGVLDAGKLKSNSKSYSLTVIANNPLLTVPSDLEILYSKFEDFVKIVAQLYKGPSSKEKNPSKSKTQRLEVDLAYRSLPILPYDLIEIIDKIYNYYFIFVLPNEIKNNVLRTKLYPAYFETILKMRTLVTKEIKYSENIYDLTRLTESPMYDSYISSDILPGLERLAVVRRNCLIVGIDKSLLDVLHFLWTKNKNLLPLVYNFSFYLTEDQIKYYLQQSGKDLADYYEYDEKSIKYLHIYTDSYASELLNEIGHY